MSGDRRVRGLPEELAANRGAAAVAAVVLVLAAVLVVGSLRRPELPTYPPSGPGTRPAAGRLVGPTTYTVDARESDRWQLFSFSEGGAVEETDGSEWDLGFRRFQIIANGGDGFAGEGGALRLGAVSLDSIAELPLRGYEGTRVERGDSIVAPLEDWYTYSFLTHLLRPTGEAYAVRTADGRFAALRFLGYYCPGAQPGCVTFEYVYQGAGGPALRPGGGGSDRDG